MFRPPIEIHGPHTIALEHIRYLCILDCRQDRYDNPASCFHTRTLKLLFWGANLSASTATMCVNALHKTHSLVCISPSSVMQNSNAALAIPLGTDVEQTSISKPSVTS